MLYVSNVSCHTPKNPTSLSIEKQSFLWDTVTNIPTLTEYQKDEFYTLLTCFADVFPDNDDDLGRTKVCKHHINTADATPVHQPP